MVDLLARVTAVETVDNDFIGQCGICRHFKRQQDIHTLASGAARPEVALGLGVDIYHALTAEHACVDADRAVHADLLIDGEHNLERRML